MNNKFNRIFYDKATGKILYQLYLDEPEYVTDFAILEIPKGIIEYETHFIESIDSNGQPVIKAYPLTNEQRIAELEDTILLHTDTNIGGIL